MASPAPHSISRSSSTEDSPEYSAMRENYDTLVDLLSPSIAGLARTFFAKELIPKAIMEKVRIGSIPEADKAGEVLTHLMSRVKLDSSVFQTIINIFVENDSSNKAIVEKLIESYKSHTAHYKEVVSHNSI